MPIYNHAFLLFLILGCITAPSQYIPRPIGDDDGSVGGYQDFRLGKNLYKVSFDGNERTSWEKTEDWFLRRCAELTLENDYQYFTITEKMNTTKRTHFGSPRRMHHSTGLYPSSTIAPYVTIRPGIQGIATMFKAGEQPKEAFSALDVLSNFKPADPQSFGPSVEQ